MILVDGWAEQEGLPEGLRDQVLAQWARPTVSSPSFSTPGDFVRLLSPVPEALG